MTNCQRAAVIDKERLLKVVSSLGVNTVGDVNFAFCKKILIPGTLKPFKVDKLGKIPIPVSLKDFQRLKKVSSPSYYGKGFNKFLDSSKRLAFEVDGKKIDSTTAEEMSLSSLVMNHLELPSELMNVQAKLDHMILYESGGHYQHTLDSEKEYGSFGTLILQLPVEGGHVGGRLKVKYQGKEQVYDSEKDSDSSCHAYAYFHNSQHSMETLKRGVKVTLIFNLVWENAQQEIPEDFPVLLTVLKEIKESLSSWISADGSIPTTKSKFLQITRLSDRLSYLLGKEEYQDDDEDNEEDEDEADEEEDKEEDEEEDEEEDKEEDEDEAEEEAEEEEDEEEEEEDDEDEDDEDEEDEDEEDDDENEDLLYFLLEEKYEENEFGFSGLKGKDKDLSQIFQYCSFVEQHLSVVTQITKITSRDCQRDYLNCQSYRNLKFSSPPYISRWEDSEGISRNLSIDINWKKQCVGRDLPTTDYDELDSEADSCDNCEKTNSEEYIKHFILVIWPKHQTIRLYCDYGLHSLLKKLEFDKSVIRLREKSKEELSKTISYCCSDPRMWKCQTRLAEGELTERLLRLCIDLRAREEGLALLKNLSADFRIPQRSCILEEMLFIGIQTEKVAKAIAEFECLVTGWNDCADLIKQIISPARIVKQLGTIIKLAQFLLDVDCFEGAKLVEEGIASFFMNVDKQQALNIKQPEILSFIELIINLEEHAETSHPDGQRFYSIRSIVEKVSIHKLTDILEGVTKIKTNEVNVCSSTVTIVRHIYHSLISRLKENATAIMPERKVILHAIRVLSMFHASFTQDFLKQICENEEAGSWSWEEKYNLFVILIRNPDVWEILDDKSKVIILKCCDKLIQDWVVDICGSINVPTTSIVTSTKLDESILISVRLFFFVERKRFGLREKKITSPLQPLISKLNSSQLLELVLKLHQSDSSTDANIKLDIKKFPDCMGWYRGICKLLFTMDYISLISMEKATQILYCLLWLEDQQSWQSFAFSVCNALPSVHQSHFFVQVFIKDRRIERKVEDSSSAFNAFLRIVHPQVYAFLQSESEVMTYQKFSGISEARHFAKTLQRMGKSLNFSGSITLSGCGMQSRCIIRKTCIVKENLKAKPLARPISSQPTATDDEACNVSPPKRPSFYSKH